MNDATLAELEHENLIEAFGQTAARVPDAIVRHERGVLLFSTGLPVRLFNQVVIELESAVPEAIAAGIAVLRDRDAPFEVNLRRGTDDRFEGVVEGLGLQVPAGGGVMPGMALYPLPSGSSADAPDLEIRRIGDAAGLEDHVRTAASGFGMSEDLLWPWVGTDLWKRPGFVVYVGYADGEPVTTGLGIRTGRTIGVYNIATVPDARRRGFGAAMTERVVADGAAAGCDVAILQSSTMGRPVYERLGFRLVVEYVGWTDPIEDEAAASA